MIPFSNLVLERKIFEVRYETAFLFWDNSGKLVGDLIGKFPKFKVREVTPANVIWEWLDEGIAFSFSQLKADVTQEFPEKSEPFKSVCETLSSLIAKHLAVSSFTRTGVRLLFVLPARNEDTALELVKETHLSSMDAKRFMPFGDKIMEQHFGLRIEDEDGGAWIRVGNVKREFSTNLSRAFPIDSKRFNPCVLSIDLDSYTKKLVDTDIFSPVDFIRKVEKNAEENLMTLVGLG